MQVGNVDFLRTRTIPVSHTVGDDAEALIACNHIAQMHLDVAKELVFREPATGVRNFHVATADLDDRACGGGGHPIRGCILACDHLPFWSEVNCATNRVIV